MGAPNRFTHTYTCGHQGTLIEGASPFSDLQICSVYVCAVALPVSSFPNANSFAVQRITVSDPEAHKVYISVLKARTCI